MQSIAMKLSILTVEHCCTYVDAKNIINLQREEF
jgi:hypothetical protein